MKTTAFLASCIASMGLAAEPMTLPPIAVTVTSPNYCCDVNFKALILQPFANNLDYGAEAIPFNYDSSDMDPAVSPSWVIPNINPGFHFGFDLGISTIFHCANSNLMLNWERFHSSDDSDSFTVDNSNFMFGTFFEIGPDASPYKTGKGTTNFHFDEVNLDYGTFVQFGPLLQMNLFAGVSFARIKQHLFTKISNIGVTIIRTLDVPASFTGAGPQLGIDFSCKVVKGLRFMGNAKASLFVGNFTNSTTFTTASQALIDLGNASPNIQTTTVYDKNGIVPGIEGKLGFAYEKLFCCKYLAKIEAGYQAQIYVNSIRSVDIGSEVTLGTSGTEVSATTGVYARTFERTVSDFCLAGPYASIDVGF